MKHRRLLAIFFLCSAGYAQALPSSLGVADGLGERFDSPLEGISLCPPAGSTQEKQSDNPDLLVEFTNADRQWNLKVFRIHTPTPVPLTTTKDDKGQVHKGIQESAVEELQKQLPGCQIVRNDQTNVADSVGKYPNVGMIAVRFVEGIAAHLDQRAIIQGDDSYYMLDFVTLGAKPGTPDDQIDPNEKAAVDIFTAMLDSVRLRDNSAIKEDQIQRLFRTHSFLYTLTPATLQRALVPEQWFRIVHEGKDIGYTYITEELSKVANREGFRITVRSRTFPPKGQQDTESELFCAFDRSHEQWTSSGSLVIENQSPLNVAEVGISDRMFKSLDAKPPPIIGEFRAPTTQPARKTAELYKLSVTFTHGSVKPLTDMLPPYYIQQALGHLLPRLLPREHPTTYLFATYVPEQRQVIMRYVDVGKEREMSLFGQHVRAIPISDRLGYDGPVTNHYISPDGQYLGSVNIKSQTQLIPSNALAIESLFPKQQQRTVP